MLLASFDIREVGGVRQVVHGTCVKFDLETILGLFCLRRAVLPGGYVENGLANSRPLL